jgi:hypothetical protein
VLSIRSENPWFPMPTFTTGIWLAGLAIFVLILASLAPGVRHGGTAIWLLSWVLGVVMLLNGVGHLVGSLYFQRWLPGATTAPLLLATSALLMRATWHRYHSD